MLIATAARGSSTKALTKDIIVAKATSTSESRISSLSTMEVIDYGNPKQVLRFYSVLYGVDYDKLATTIQQESEFKHEGVFGDYDKLGIPRAYGIAQFHRDTFNRYCSGEYKNMDDQLHCMVYMFSIGQQAQWSGYCKYYYCKPKTPL